MEKKPALDGHNNGHGSNGYDSSCGSNGKGHLYGYHVIDNCPKCQGAVFVYLSHTPELLTSGGKPLYQCFHCATIFLKKGETFVPWIRKSGVLPEREESGSDNDWWGYEVRK